MSLTTEEHPVGDRAVILMTRLVDVHPIPHGWIERLKALATFLLGYFPLHTIRIHAVEAHGIHGLRVDEVNLRLAGNTGNERLGNAVFQRVLSGSAEVILSAELFLQTCGEEPYRPEGWQSYVNNHGSARCRLLLALGRDDHARAEHGQQQLLESELAGTAGKPQL